MKINEPSAAFKLLGGHIVLHFALVTVLAIFYYKPEYVLKYACSQPSEKRTMITLLISHIVSAAVSLLYEISTF